MLESALVASSIEKFRVDAWIVILILLIMRVHFNGTIMLELNQLTLMW